MYPIDQILDSDWIDPYLTELANDNEIRELIEIGGLGEPSESTTRQGRRYTPTPPPRGLRVPEFQNICYVSPCAKRRRLKTVLYPGAMTIDNELPKPSHCHSAAVWPSACSLPVAPPLVVPLVVPLAVPLAPPSAPLGFAPLVQPTLAPPHLPQNVPRVFRTCAKCGVSDTPRWREDLCNACGIQAKRKNSKITVPLRC